jgi:AraC family transcriptional activator of mtrCDE
MCSLVTAALPKAIVLSIGRTDLFDRMRMLVQAIDEELQAAVRAQRRSPPSSPALSS